MTAEQCTKIEKVLVRNMVWDVLKAGYSVSVDNGEEEVVETSTNYEEIMDALFSVDEEHLVLYKNKLRSGYILLVHGNDGWDVVSDYSIDLTQVLQPTNDLADNIAEIFS